MSKKSKKSKCEVLYRRVEETSRESARLKRKLDQYYSKDDPRMDKAEAKYFKADQAAQDAVEVFEDCVDAERGRKRPTRTFRDMETSSGYRVEFQVPGSDRWESAYGTYATEPAAREAMRANIRELRSEGNVPGKFRVVAGRGRSQPVNWLQWAAIGLGVAAVAVVARKS